MLTLSTLYRILKTEKLKTSMTFSVRSTIEKNGRRKNKQNVRVSSKKIRMRKEEGATVAATPYLLRCDTVRAGLARAERAAILHGDKLYRKAP